MLDLLPLTLPTCISPRSKSTGRCRPLHRGRVAPPPEMTADGIGPISKGLVTRLTMFADQRWDGRAPRGQVGTASFSLRVLRRRPTFPDHHPRSARARHPESRRASPTAIGRSPSRAADLIDPDRLQGNLRIGCLKPPIVVGLRAVKSISCASRPWAISRSTSAALGLLARWNCDVTCPRFDHWLMSAATGKTVGLLALALWRRLRNLPCRRNATAIRPRRERLKVENLYPDA